jgi:glycosyltransferase involved in cell wall biosynthesis
MACGLPVICTAVGGNTELVSHDQNGFLIRPGDDAALANAIRDYWLSPQKRIVHGQNARRFVHQNLSLDRMVARYVALYESAA